MVNRVTKSVIVIVCITFMLGSHITTFANRISPKKAVVFLIDASGSMKENDPQKLALDRALQLVHSLPTQYEVGMVAYAGDVVLQVDLVANENRSQIVNGMGAIEYSGYSNASAGLEAALLMLEGVEDSHIVMLSDGEILLHTESATNEARELFSTQVIVAKENETKVHLIALAEETLLDGELVTIAEQTNGSFHYAVGAMDMESVIENILTKELGVSKISLGVTNTKQGIFQMELSLVKGSDVSRILLTSTTELRDLVVHFEADKAQQYVGKQYAFIELTNPMTEGITLSVETLEQGEVSVYVISEVTVCIETNVVYEDTLPEDEEATSYYRSAKIDLVLTNQLGKPIFTEELFENSSIEVMVEEEAIMVPLKSGTLSFVLEVDQGREVSVVPDFSTLPVQVITVEDRIIVLEAPPLIESVAQPSYLPIVLLGVLLIILILLIFINKKKNRSALPPVKEEKEAPSKYSYTGKLNLYITRGKKDIDYPPLTFNLFHLSNGRKITLEEILKRLEVKEVMEGANQISFSPSVNGKLILINDSACSILKNRELILKGKSVELLVDSKLDIAFEDEISELVLQYKDGK